MKTNPKKRKICIKNAIKKIIYNKKKQKPHFQESPNLKKEALKPKEKKRLLVVKTK